jgi:hypothetical protein
VARAKVAAKPATFPRVYTKSKILPFSTEKQRKGIFEIKLNILLHSHLHGSLPLGAIGHFQGDISTVKRKRIGAR